MTLLTIAACWLTAAPIAALAAGRLFRRPPVVDPRFQQMQQALRHRRRQ